MQIESTSIIAAARDIDSSAVIAGLAILGGFTVAIVSTVGGIFAGVRSRREREETKRELAAYVAEGSLTSDQAERLIRADDSGADEVRCGPKRRRREAREDSRSGSREAASSS